MLQETTLKEIISTIANGTGKITDNSNCGNCSKCGECCTNFLPISQNELNIIKEYVIKNKIRPQTHMLVMQNRLSCPYYDGHKCLIYEVRPMICKEFYCYKRPSLEMAESIAKEKRTTVNMWAIAKEIDRYI